MVKRLHDKSIHKSRLKRLRKQNQPKKTRATVVRGVLREPGQDSRRFVLSGGGVGDDLCGSPYGQMFLLSGGGAGGGRGFSFRGPRRTARRAVFDKPRGADIEGRESRGTI